MRRFRATTPDFIKELGDERRDEERGENEVKKRALKFEQAHVCTTRRLERELFFV